MNRGIQMSDMDIIVDAGHVYLYAHIMETTWKHVIGVLVALTFILCEYIQQTYVDLVAAHAIHVVITIVDVCILEPMSYARHPDSSTLPQCMNRISVVCACTTKRGKYAGKYRCRSSIVCTIFCSFHFSEFGLFNFCWFIVQIQAPKKRRDRTACQPQ